MEYFSSEPCGLELEHAPLLLKHILAGILTRLVLTEEDCRYGRAVQSNSYQRGKVKLSHYTGIQGELSARGGRLVQ